MSLGARQRRASDKGGVRIQLLSDRRMWSRSDNVFGAWKTRLETNFLAACTRQYTPPPQRSVHCSSPSSEPQFWQRSTRQVRSSRFVMRSLQIVARVISHRQGGFIVQDSDRSVVSSPPRKLSQSTKRGQSGYRPVEGCGREHRSSDVDPVLRSPLMSILKHSRSARRVVKAYPTFQTGLLAGNLAATPGTRTLRTWYRIGGAPHRRWYLISIAMTMAAMILPTSSPAHQRRSHRSITRSEAAFVTAHGGSATLQQCMALWDVATHMSKPANLSAVPADAFLSRRRWSP